MADIAVKTLKEYLNAHGANLTLSNANFGESTEKAVKAFQKKYGLIQDGVVDQLTWDTLQGYTILPSKTVEQKKFLDWVAEILLSQVGIKEQTGKNDGVQVEYYLKRVGLGKGYAWCQAFMYYGFEYAAEILKVKNPMPKTAGVLDCWNKSKAFQVKKGASPQAGDVFTMDFGKGQGHCGFVLKVEGDYIYTVEGNTSADPSLPSEDREGQGVFKRRRKISSINNGFIRYTIS